MPRIMLIDDDDDIIDSMTMILEDHGFEVTSKKDTADIVRAVLAAEPDLVIMDIMFPEDPQAGFIAMRQLRADAIAAHIPILVLSAVNQRRGMGFKMDDHLDEEFLSMNDFMEKPLEPKALLAKVSEMLGRRRVL